MTAPRLREAIAEDAGTVARLHADSWRRHYRGVYADSFLDGDVVADRRSVWSAKLAAPAGTMTVLAESGAEPVGFVHVAFDHDERWGSMVGNLHVSHAYQRQGLGRILLRHAADAMTDRATHGSWYLWVLEYNTAAQTFYRALGGNLVERAIVSAPGGVPGRLVGTPHKLRLSWPAD